MGKSVVTVEGQVVIPSKLGHTFGIKKESRSTSTTVAISAAIPVFHNSLNSSGVISAWRSSFRRSPGPSSRCCGMDRVY